jgi:hypothetical protein
MQNTFALRLAIWLQGRGIHSGWDVAATTFLTMLSTAAAMGSAGIMIETLRAGFGWCCLVCSGPLLRHS